MTNRELNNSLTVAETRYKIEYENNKDNIKYLSLFKINNDSLVINKDNLKKINYKNISENIIDIRNIDKKFYSVLNIMYYNFNDSMKDYDIEYFLKNENIDIDRYIKYKNILLNKIGFNSEILKYKPKEVKNITWMNELKTYIKENNITTLVRVKINKEDFKIMNSDLRELVSKECNLFDRTKIDDYILNIYPFELLEKENFNKFTNINKDIKERYPGFNDKFYNIFTKKVIYNLFHRNKN
jgi:hypothetical protein